MPGAAPLAVSISVSHEQNNTINLYWEPPPHDTHNGIIQGYQVRTGADPIAPRTEWTLTGLFAHSGVVHGF